jgi:hypothetical protein
VHTYNNFNCSLFKKFFLLSNNYASLDIIVKQKAGYGQRINMYKRKNPLAMSFLLTAKGLVFTISQQMLQASKT